MKSIRISSHTQRNFSHLSSWWKSLTNYFLHSYSGQVTALPVTSLHWYYSNLLLYRKNFLIFLNKSPFPLKKALHSYHTSERLRFYQVLSKLSRKSARPVLASDTWRHPFTCSNRLLLLKEQGGLGNPALLHTQCHETALNPKGLHVVTTACLHRTNWSNRA